MFFDVLTVYIYLSLHIFLPSHSDDATRDIYCLGLAFLFFYELYNIITFQSKVLSFFLSLKRDNDFLTIVADHSTIHVH